MVPFRAGRSGCPACIRSDDGVGERMVPLHGRNKEVGEWLRHFDKVNARVLRWRFGSMFEGVGAGKAAHGFGEKIRPPKNNFYVGVPIISSGNK